ncbi:uncharacterized protein LOC114355503 isoform X2 [Ostrinia furnacalis]|uniref:uncharacterized protein LOC114355503 isoform X2 n=1 Tax=Ostrinia furnacalis TaxID=93504 RepID=UPI0010405AB0|nr:uncharacterized protein LOC114355503 isoform X2 [Ostrinia furnacalis]
MMTLKCTTPVQVDYCPEKQHLRAFKAELLENQLISKRTSRKLWKKTQETHFVRNDRRVNYAIGCLGRRKAERCNKQQHDGAAEW